MTDQQQQHIKKNWEHTHIHRASQVASSKEVVYNAGDAGSIPGWENPLEEEMITHSSILVWKIP